MLINDGNGEMEDYLIFTGTAPFFYAEPPEAGWHQSFVADLDQDSDQDLILRTEETFQVWLNDDVVNAGPLSIEENPFSRTISAYPNPTSSWLAIESEQFQGKSPLFQWSDLSGRTWSVKSKRFESGSYRFDLSSLPKGVYLLTVELDGQKGVKRIVR